MSWRACAKPLGVLFPKMPPASMQSCRRRNGRMPFPRVRAENLVYLLECEIAFLKPIVEMRREAHPGFRPEIHQDFPRQQFAADFISMRAVDGNRPRALRRIFRSVDAPAVSLGALEQACGHAHRFSAYRLDAHRIEDVQPGLARIQRRNVRRAVQIAERIFARIDCPGFEVEWAAMRALDNCLRVDDVGAAEEHMRYRHEQGVLIDGRKKPV